MKSYTREEFLEYVKGLEFEELEDAANFVTYYYEFYKALPDDPKDEKDAAWEKYMILMSKFGMMFTAFTLMVIEYRKNLNKEIENDNRNPDQGKVSQ